jgi:hypothetical protein
VGGKDYNHYYEEPSRFKKHSKVDFSFKGSRIKIQNPVLRHSVEPNLERILIQNIKIKPPLLKVNKK